MVTAISLTGPERQQLSDINTRLSKNGCLAGLSITAAAFLIIGALIVITCGGLCLTLPGVNAISDVVLPAFVPGFVAIVTSIPFIVRSVRLSRVNTENHKKMILDMISYLDTHKIPEASRNERVHFILTEFLGWIPDPNHPGDLLKNFDISDFRQRKILTEIQEKTGKQPKDRNPRQKKIAKAIEKAMMATQKKRYEPPKEKK